MNPPDFSAAPLQHLLPALGLVLAVNLLVALIRRRLRRLRYLLCAIVAAAPALIPEHLVSIHPWGIMATVVTTLAIISAARLPDLDQSLKAKRRGSLELFLWMTLPMARSFPVSHRRRRLNRQRSGRYFIVGAAKRLCWEPFAFITLYVDGGNVPWPVRSAFLMLYFVLNMTALSDICTGFCLVLGADVDVIFDAPLRSRSPRDFWSRRWNKFINRFALKHVAMPVGRYWNTGGVILTVFLTSGAFHEYFAWGVGRSQAAYGSMMLFFLLQGIVVLLATRWKVPAPRPVLGMALTFLWMVITAPLFFMAVRPALLAFNYPESWFPF